MSKTIIFSTGNGRKFAEACEAAKLFDVVVDQKELEITEIQSENSMLVSEHKVRTAFEQLQKPVVVTDSSWNIPALNGFPGAYMKSVADWFTEQDFLDLMTKKSDKRIAFSENISYFDGKLFKQFTKEYWGVFVDTPRGTGNSIENVVEFDGVTLGEKRQQGGFSHKPQDYIWNDFFVWFTQK